MINVAALRTARVAVLGLEVSTGQPPRIVQAAVYHVDGGAITADPLCFWTDPDVPLHQVRTSSWPNVRLAPPWPQVAERVTVAIGDLTNPRTPMVRGSQPAPARARRAGGSRAPVSTKRGSSPWT